MDKLIKKISSKLPMTSVAGSLKPAIIEIPVGLIDETKNRVMNDPRHKGSSTIDMDIDEHSVSCIYIPTLKKWQVIISDGNQAFKCFIFNKPEKQSKSSAVDPRKLSQEELEHYVFDLGYTEWEKYLK